MRKQSKKRTNKLAYTLMTIGIVLLLLPFLFSWYTTRQQGAAKTIYDRSAKQLTGTLAAARRYNQEIYRQQKTFARADGAKMAPAVFGSQIKAPMGYIEIPSIHIKNMMIYYGDTDEVLSRGIGNMPWTSLPVGGRNTMASLTGHSGLANQVYFDNIKKLEKGDHVFVHTFGRHLAYEVTGETKVIDPKRPEAPKNFFVRDQQDMLTLMTCTPVFINSKRLLVFAKRVPYQEARQRPQQVRDWFSLDHLFVMFVIVFLIIVAAILWRRRMKSRKED